MKWILICVALYLHPDGAREMFIFNQQFDSVEECKQYAFVNKDEIQMSVISQIGPFTAICADKETFEKEVLPTLENPNKKKGLEA